MQTDRSNERQTGPGETGGQLSERVVVVTGAAGAIGAAIAELLCHHGAAVVLADIDLPGAEEVAHRLRDQGGRAVAQHVDVTSAADVHAMVEATDAAFGPVDVFVNNAAGGPGDDLLVIDEETWTRDIAVTLNGPFLCVKAVLPSMVERGHGVFVNVASVAALGAFGTEAYSAAKAGLISLTQAIAARYGPHGVRANAIAPATIRTNAPNWQERLERDPQVFERVSQWYPLRRVGRPDDIAQAVLFMASDASSWITGTTLVVDGGLTAGNMRFAETFLGPDSERPATHQG